jgi:hypothetical protein
MKRLNYGILFKQLLLHLCEYQLFVVCIFGYYLDVDHVHDAMDETKFSKNFIKKKNKYLDHIQYEMAEIFHEVVVDKLKKEHNLFE